MIKNSLLLEGMPQTAKTTRVQNQWMKDYKQGYYDLSITLWNFLHSTPKGLDKHFTIPYLSSVHGRTPALQLSHNYKYWENQIGMFAKKHGKAKHIFIDEAYCIRPVFLDLIAMVVRDFYPESVPIIYTSIDYDSWHHKLSSIDAISKLCEKTKHLNHQCQMPGCHNIADRRLHVALFGHTWKPCYNQRTYNKKIFKNRKCLMISVCNDHYLLNQGRLNDLMKENAKLVKKHQAERRKQKKNN